MESTGRLRGRVAVITGGASGIGLGIARRFLLEGASVALGDLNADALRSIGHELGPACSTCAGDVTNEADVEALLSTAVDRFGKVDLAVNAAGRGHYAPIVDHEVAEFRSILDLCVTGVLLSMKHEARQMISQGEGGSIINIASLSSSQPSAGMSAYCTAKAGVSMLTQVAAMEFGPHRIRVNAIAPGLIDLDTLVTAEMHSVDAIRHSLVDNTPLGRGGTTDDVAGAALYLASDDSSFVTAETLFVDGGGHTGRYLELGSILLGTQG